MTWISLSSIFRRGTFKNKIYQIFLWYNYTWYSSFSPAYCLVPELWRHVVSLLILLRNSPQEVDIVPLTHICFADLNMQPRHWKHARDTILLLQESYLRYNTLALGRITLSTRWLLRSTKRTAKLGTHFTTWVINPILVWIKSNVNRYKNKNWNTFL